MAVAMALISNWARLTWALILADLSAGSSRPARIPMIAMTTRSSISVKARRYLRTEGGRSRGTNPKPGLSRDGDGERPLGSRSDQRSGMETPRRTMTRGCQVDSSHVIGSDFSLVRSLRGIGSLVPGVDIERLFVPVADQFDFAADFYGKPQVVSARVVGGGGGIVTPGIDAGDIEDGLPVERRTAGLPGEPDQDPDFSGVGEVGVTSGFEALQEILGGPAFISRGAAGGIDEAGDFGPEPERHAGSGDGRVAVEGLVGLVVVELGAGQFVEKLVEGVIVGVVRRIMADLGFVRFDGGDQVFHFGAGAAGDFSAVDGPGDGQDKRGEDGHDGDDHQQFDEGESPATSGGNPAHLPGRFKNRGQDIGRGCSGFHDLGRYLSRNSSSIRSLSHCLIMLW